MSRIITLYAFLAITFGAGLSVLSNAQPSAGEIAIAIGIMTFAVIMAALMAFSIYLSHGER